MSVAWVGAGIAAVGVVSNTIGANKAANAQSAAANAANAEAQREYDQTRSDQLPYRHAGYTALNRIEDLLGLSKNTSAPGYGTFGKPLSVTDVENDPGYQFGLTQGLKTQQNSAAARGGLYSGAELKAISQYGNDYATTKYDDAYSRAKNAQDTIFNRLSGVSGTGQTATQAVDAAGQQTANTIGGNLIGAGNARGLASIATSNAVSNGANQAAAWWLTKPPGSSYQYDGNDPAYGGAASYDQGGGGLNYGAGGDAGVYSDARLKTNVRRIGTTERGNGWYSWDWKTGGSGEGVIAQEVAHIPGAVSTDANGLLMVDYSKV